MVSKLHVGGGGGGGGGGREGEYSADDNTVRTGLLEHSS